jgi:hypothetical protein
MTSEQIRQLLTNSANRHHNFASQINVALENEKPRRQPGLKMTVLTGCLATRGRCYGQL